MSRDEKTKPNCPQCGKPLEQVRYPSGSMLNRDQWDSIRAGDYVCYSCPSNNEAEAPTPTARISCPVCGVWTGSPEEYWTHKHVEAEAPRGDQPTKEMSQNEHNREMDSHVNDPGVVTSGLYAGETRADGEGCREFMQSEFLAALSVKAPGVAFAGDVRQYVDAVIYNHIEDRLNAVLPDSLNRSMEDRIELLLERADREASLAVKLRNQLEANSAPSVDQLIQNVVKKLEAIDRMLLDERCSRAIIRMNVIDVSNALYRHMQALSKEKE